MTAPEGSGEAPTCRRLCPLTVEQTERRRKDFIGSIDPGAVCRLATRHHGSMPCRMFRTEPASGSFNVCYFVEFPSDGTRWVVRVPIAPVIQDVWAKLQSEVATMRYVAARSLRGRQAHSQE